MWMRIVTATVLATLAIVTTASAQQPDVAKLIAQLGADDFRVREQATNKLLKLGAPILPTLRKAAAGEASIEVRRRIERIIQRIEGDLIEAEVKQWEKLEAPRGAVKDRVKQIIARTPGLTDAKLVEAIFLVTVARPPSADELAKGQDRLKGPLRLLPALEIARDLVQTKEFNAGVGTASARMLAIQKSVQDADAREAIARVNSEEFQKQIRETGIAIDKAAGSDERFAELSFLIMLSRYPDPETMRTVLAHLKRRASDRPHGTAEIIWAMMNTKEFLAVP